MREPFPEQEPVPREESGPRRVPEPVVMNYRLEQDEKGEWIAYTAPDVMLRGPDRESAARRALSAVLRAAAMRIEAGEITPPESFVFSVRRQ